MVFVGQRGSSRMSRVDSGISEVGPLDDSSLSLSCDSSLLLLSTPPGGSRREAASSGFASLSSAMGSTHGSLPDGDSCSGSRRHSSTGGEQYHLHQQHHGQQHQHQQPSAPGLAAAVAAAGVHRHRGRHDLSVGDEPHIYEDIEGSGGGGHGPPKIAPVSGVLSKGKVVIRPIAFKPVVPTSSTTSLHSVASGTGSDVHRAVRCLTSASGTPSGSLHGSVVTLNGSTASNVPGTPVSGCSVASTATTTSGFLRRTPVFRATSTGGSRSPNSALGISSSNNQLNHRLNPHHHPLRSNGPGSLIGGSCSSFGGGSLIAGSAGRGATTTTASPLSSYLSYESELNRHSTVAGSLDNVFGAANGHHHFHHRGRNHHHQGRHQHQHHSLPPAPPPSSSSPSSAYHLLVEADARRSVLSSTPVAAVVPPGTPLSAVSGSTYRRRGTSSGLGDTPGSSASGSSTSDDDDDQDDFDETPSPSDSGVAELEAALKEKDSEIVYLRETMEQNEQVIFKVYEEKEMSWQREVKRVKGQYDAKLKSCHQRALKMEQMLMMQTYQLQQDKRKLRQETEEAKRDKEAVEQQLESARRDLESLRAQLEETEWSLCQKSGEISLLKSQLKDAQGDQTNRATELVQGRAQLKESRAEATALAEQVSSLKRELESATRGRQKDEQRLEEQREERERRAAEEEERVRERRHLDRLQAQVEATRSQLAAQRQQFEEERVRWVEEKDKVIRYQKQLQLNYVQMYRRNRTLETEVEQLTLELEGRDVKLINGESHC